MTGYDAAPRPEPLPATEGPILGTGQRPGPALGTGQPAGATAAADPLAEVRPAYGAASLADVLPGVLATLGVPGVPDPLDLASVLSGVRRVAVLLVDGLGWYQLAQASRYAPVLADLASGRLGGSRSLTSGFPSTTPTSLVTLGTGAAPGAHGVLGFTVLCPQLGQVLNHIRWRDEPDPAWWQPLPTRLEQAAGAGVAVTVVTKPEFDGSGLTLAAYRGGRFRPAADGPAVAARMLAALRDGDGPALVYGYLADVDHAGHVHGVDSAQWCAAVADLQAPLAELIAGLPPDCALLVTADHGQLDIPPAGRLDIAAVPALTAGVATVAGEPRVRYLHTVPGATPDVLAAWRETLGAAAWVGTRDEAVAAGWFGPVPEEHLGRIGEVVAFSRARNVILSGGTEPARVAAMVAFHGSSTAVEMTVPLLVARG